MYIISQDVKTSNPSSTDQMSPQSKEPLVYRGLVTDSYGAHLQDSSTSVLGDISSSYMYKFLLFKSTLARAQLPLVQY